MNNDQFTNQFNIIVLKRKILYHIKNIISLSSSELNLFFRGLDLLKDRYTNPVDYNFIDLGIKNKLEHKQSDSICVMNICASLNNCNNEELLKDLFTLINPN